MYQLSSSLHAKISATLESRKSPELYFDYRDGVDTDTISESLQEQYPLDKITMKVEDWNRDSIYELEISHLADVLTEFKDELCLDLEIFPDFFNEKELASDLRDGFLDHLAVDLNIKDLLRGTVNVRIEMNSNFDCINSHWYEEQSGGYSMEGYFGDVVRNLRLDPAKVKRMLASNGVKVYGQWPKRSDRKALISYEAFWQEIENRSCGANLLVFVGKIGLYDFLNAPRKSFSICIPKGNYMGFFSPFQGGGSTIEAPLNHDLVIDLSRPWGKTTEDSFQLIIDADKSAGHGIDYVYGVTSSFWGKEIRIIPNPSDLQAEN